jgi:prevent-host-death family protein
MRSVSVSELRKQLRKYLRLAKDGETVVICDRGLPFAELIPFVAVDASREELLLVGAGKMRLPKARTNLSQLLKIKTGRVRGNRAVEVLLADRDGR